MVKRARPGRAAAKPARAAAPSGPAASPARDEPWYAAGLRFSCTGCGACCHARGKYAYVYVDDAEADAMAARLHLTRARFEREYCEFQPQDGQRLLRFVDGKCVFLKDERCGIYEQRPRQCRTWPFWTQNLVKRTWDREIAPFSPGIGRGRLYSRDEIEAIARESEDP